MDVMCLLLDGGWGSNLSPLHLGFFFIDMGNSSMPISQWEFVDYWLNFSGAFLIGFAFYIVGYMVKIIK